QGAEQRDGRLDRDVAALDLIRTGRRRRPVATQVAGDGLVGGYGAAAAAHRERGGLRPGRVEGGGRAPGVDGDRRGQAQARDVQREVGGGAHGRRVGRCGQRAGDGDRLRPGQRDV